MKTTMLKTSALVFVVVVVVLEVARCDEAPTVRTEAGWVAGELEKIDSGRSIYAYRGIPYAEPPLGRLRLKPPAAKIGWDGVRPSTKDTPMCQHVDFFSMLKSVEDVQGAEDCLYLSLFKPVGDRSEQLPVMVFIHGGAFFFGTSLYYEPNKFLEHDVILIVMQYRLGILGFLSTEDDVMPGNLGLMDQTEALRWVQRNIDQFGGDPDRVTLFGQSAGGASVNYQLLSPLTKGLFSGAIIQSGSAMDPWSKGGDFRQVAEKVGKDMGCPDVKHSDALLSCLQKVPSVPLVATILQYFKLGMDPVKLAPRVDGMVLPEVPALLVKEGRHHHIPVMAGITSHEGCWTTALVYSNTSLVQLLTESKEVQLASLELGDEDVEPSDIAARVFKRYMGGPHFGEEHAEEVTQMYGDRLFVVPLELMSRYYSRTGPIYTYEISHVTEQSLTTMFAGKKLPYKWVCHADELLHLFPGGPLFKLYSLTSPDDLKVSDIMAKLWVNFATFRNPTPDDSLGFKWTQHTPSDPSSLHLRPDPVMIRSSRQEILDFWQSLPLRENLVLAPEKVVYQDDLKDEL